MDFLFFGSTTDSVIVAEALAQAEYIPNAVITQEPKPQGRNRVVTPTPVDHWARERGIPVCTFATIPEKPWVYRDEQTVVRTLQPFSPDLCISASYGQKIPQSVLSACRYGGLNVHPSLLPRLRGTDPIPWTIMHGDTETGVTVVTLSERFDTGKIIAQQSIPLDDTAEPATIRSTLFSLGATLLTHTLPSYLANPMQGTPQDSARAVYARRITRDDGFIPWDAVCAAARGETIPPEKQPGILPVAGTTLSGAINRAVRALSPWPGVWTNIPLPEHSGKPDTGEKRLKILKTHMDDDRLIITEIQLEGKHPSPFNQFLNAYNISLDKPALQTVR